MTKQKMKRRDEKDLRAVLKTMQEAGKLSNLKLVSTPWYKRWWRQWRTWVLRKRMQKVLARER